jgi:hypothetical protein
VKRCTQKHRSAQRHEERDPATGGYVCHEAARDDIESESGSNEGETLTLSAAFNKLAMVVFRDLGDNIPGMEMIVTKYFCSLCNTDFNIDKIQHCQTEEHRNNCVAHLKKVNYPLISAVTV